MNTIQPRRSTHSTHSAIQAIQVVQAIGAKIAQMMIKARKFVNM